MPIRAVSIADTKETPACSAALESGGVRIAVSGDWTLATLSEARAALRELTAVPPGGQAKIDLGQLRKLDTAGALSLIGLRNRLGARRPIS